jgi:diguanylate cyclase (GGDEF)-like protein/PAS domain S-box-containing protein
MVVYRIVTCLTAQHDYRLVLLAALICITATFTAFSIYSHVVASTGYRRVAWTILTGVCTAAGIWATHFVAMLAYESGYPTAYEPVATVCSLLVAIVVTASGFLLSAQQAPWSTTAGGAVIGAGIGAMHYTGMSAVIVPGSLSWDTPIVVTSVLIGIALTSVAVVCYHRNTGLRATTTAAVIMSLAICGLHFTAMGAVTVIPDPTVVAAATSFDNSKLALAVAAVTSVLSISGLGAAFLATEARKQRETVEDHMRRTSDELAQETEERRRLFETSLDLIFITDSMGTLVRVSPSSEATLGYMPEEMIGRGGAQFVYPDDLEATRREMRQARAGVGTRNFETRYVHKDGRIVTLSWSGVWSEPEKRHFFVGRDMTERKLAEAKLRQLAHYDQLTGLPNRITLLADLSDLLGKGETALAVLDLDGFKDVNDTLGQTNGDLLLREVAVRLKQIAESRTGRVYRIGGDEFVVLVPGGHDLQHVEPIVSSMLARLSERFEITGKSLFLNASAGIAIGPGDGADVETLLSSADLALQDAKNAGKRCCRAFQPILRANAHARRALDAELRRAFAENEFVLEYQPQLRLTDGAVVGAEALLRWRHPDRGVLAPGVFIDALAKSPVARDVGRWILHTACAKAAEWRTEGHDIRIGVNLFPVHFQEDALQRDVDAALASSGLPPALLELEITENIALGQDEAILGPLRSLRELGVGVAFDDFGTGYASLSYLTRYPLSRIKIDRSFVMKIGAGSVSEDSGAIVRGVILMARQLGLQVTAEGVESQIQATFLGAEGCDEVQGFFYAKPLAPSDFELFARAQPERVHALTG